MGIDYSANYGVGYKVCPDEDLLTQDEWEGIEIDGLGEYLDDQLNGERFEYFETNDGYDTEVDATYIIVKDLLQYGLDLSQANDDLGKELKRIGCYPVTEFNVVGGVYVY